MESDRAAALFDESPSPDHPRSPAAKQGCETCHGPGSKHLGDPEVPGMIRAFRKEPRQGNETCLTCHSRRTHAMYRKRKAEL